MTAVFDEQDGAILLLRAPGRARRLRCANWRGPDRAGRAQEQHPLPVILRLAPWRPVHRHNLKTWITHS